MENCLVEIKKKEIKECPLDLILHAIFKRGHYLQFTKQVFAQVSGELRREWFPEDDETGLVLESNHQTSSSTKTNKTGFKNDDGGSRVTRDRPYTAFNRFPV